MNCNPLAHTQFVLEIFFYQAGLFKLVKMNLFLRHYNLYFESIFGQNGSNY